MSPLTAPGGRGRPAATSRFPVLLAVLGAAYAAGLALAGRTTAASLWGLNLSAFLSPSERGAVLAASLLGVALLVWAAVGRGRRATAPAEARSRGSRGARGAPSKRAGSYAAILPLYALPLLAAGFWAFRARTHFLGDGIVWLANLSSGQFPRFSEPLSAETWRGYVGALRALGLVTDEASLAGLPVICGLLAAGIFWLIAREIAPGPRSRFAAGILLLTLGVSQLYFGYIESYPIASVLVLVYLLAAVRAARSGLPDYRPGLALAFVTAAHIVSVTLVPSYVWLVARARCSWSRKALLLVLPAAVATGLFAWLRFGLDDLLRPFGAMGEALQGGTGSFGFTARGVLSARRWMDLANLALLLAPVPLIVLVARAASGGWTLRARGDATRREDAGVPSPAAFLAFAALPGLVATAFLVVPSSPAQDWDLLAIVLVPAAVAAVAAGTPALERVSRPVVAGLSLLAASGLFSFVLVNADLTAGIRRFESLLGKDAELRPHERAYGNEKLATYWSDRGEFTRAFTHARRAVDAEPTNPRYWVKAGGALVSLGRHDEAIPYFVEALRRQPGRGDASYNLGICYAKANRYSEAVGAFRTAVAADGDRPDYRHNLGLVLYAAGKTDSARIVWTEVLRRWEGYPLTVRSMERRFGAGRPDSAEQLNSVRVSPVDPATRGAEHAR